MYNIQTQHINRKWDSHYYRTHRMVWTYNFYLAHLKKLQNCVCVQCTLAIIVIKRNGTNQGAIFPFRNRKQIKLWERKTQKWTFSHHPNQPTLDGVHSFLMFYFYENYKFSIRTSEWEPFWMIYCAHVQMTFRNSNTLTHLLLLLLLRHIVVL